jgi:gluconokinase
MTAVYVIMGVSGCGKSSVGQALAARLGCPFYDGDDFHPPQNVAKMASGTPLTDADRAPWLGRLAALIAETLGQGKTAVLACSALKQQYRDQLTVSERVQFIYLHGEFDLILQRMQARQGHYMKAEMLRSQFATLEAPAPSHAWWVHIATPVDQIVDEIMLHIDQAT